MSRPVRKRFEYDYKELNRGNRVWKDRCKGTGEVMDELQRQVIDIRSDVEEFYVDFSLKDIDDEDDLQDYVSKISEIKREFRRVHAQMKASEGDEAFGKRYPNYVNEVAELDSLYRESTKRLKDAKKKSRVSAADLEVQKLERERLLTKTKFDTFRKQVDWELENCKFENLNDPDEIKSKIPEFKRLLENLFNVHDELKVCYGQDQIAKIIQNVEIDRVVTSIREVIKSGEDRVRALKDEEARLEQERIAKQEESKLLAEAARIDQEKLLEQKRIEITLNCAKSLVAEIKTRHTLFLAKCSIDLSALSEYELLDLKKREEALHVELRELIDKASSFEKFVLPIGDKADAERALVVGYRDACSAKITVYLSELSRVISERDISEKKMVNSAGLKVDLKKFEGYSSKSDIYTFRSDFKRLIEPGLQKSRWVDILKNNYLTGAALTLVLKMEDIEEIWKKLIEVYGNTHLLLQNKVGSLDRFGKLDKLTEDEKIAEQIAGLLNAIKDLQKLATDYSLENDLYHGVGLHKILDVLGRQRERKFVKSIASQQVSGKTKWLKLVEFLQAELAEREAYVLNDKVRKSVLLGKGGDKKKNDDKKDAFPGDTDRQASPPAPPPKCFVCGKDNDHVVSHKDKKSFIEYIACKKFVDMSCKERDQFLFRKRFCNKCLTPGVKFNSDHKCNQAHLCPNTFVKEGTERNCGKHVLVCGFHCGEANSAALLEVYKESALKTNKKFLDFTKQIKIACFVESYSSLPGQEAEEASIFAFQTIDVAGLPLNIFYDSGCGDMIVSKEAQDRLSDFGRAKVIDPNPIILNGVNNQESVCKHGVFTIKLPLKNGREAELKGICLDEITAPFPKYPLSEVEKDIRDNIEEGDLDLLPKLPKEVGGKVHIMLGKQYMKYFPKEIVRLESGLTLYESMFESSDHTTGVVCGPHPAFTEVHRSAHFAVGKSFSYFSPEARAYREHWSRIGSVPMLGSKESFADADLVNAFPGNGCTREEVGSANPNLALSSLKDEGVKCVIAEPFAGERESGINGDRTVFVTKRGPRCVKLQERIERAGTEVTYRCMDCRNCKECLKGGLVEEISLQEEAEQDLINKNISLDIQERCCSTNLPFLADPDKKLVTNDRMARKMFDSQVSKLSRSDKDRKDTLDSEAKLQSLGFVDWLENLDLEDQKAIMESPVQYYIPWLVVWNNTSVSTPVRTVFNGSSKTPSGYSLNDILPKGTNNLNNLVEIILRWMIKDFGYHTDVRKMYNSVKMNKAFWRFQLYLWSRTLLREEEPKIKVIKTCIYGVKCSGNQAERALRLVVELSVDEYPMAFDIVMHDVYVDDCISGERTEEERRLATDQLMQSLEKGNFILKGITFSGEDPEEQLSTDGESIMVGGMRWFSKDDYLMLNVGKIEFPRKGKGPRLSGNVPVISKRDCASVAAAVWDPTGRATPITASIKLDVHHLHREGLGWDDAIPENLRGVWQNNLEMIQELGTLKYRRCIVPPEAKNLDIVTLDTGDASSVLICVAIYARFQLKDGSYSCQLVFSRSKIVPDGTTIPRAELMAAAMNAATGFTVQRAFGKYHQRHLKFTDSMVAFHWIASQKTVLKVFVRGLVIEVNRLTDLKDWRKIDGTDMPADLGTRKGVKVQEVAPGSTWLNGKEWMSRQEEDYPAKTIEEIKLDELDMAEANKEKIVLKSYHCHKNAAFDTSASAQSKSRYEYSKYLIDPNRHRFRKVVRILSLVLTFVYQVSKKVLRVRENLIFRHKGLTQLPEIFQAVSDKYIVTDGLQIGSGMFNCKSGLVIEVSNDMLSAAFNYFILKASAEVKHFLDKRKYSHISKEVDGVLYYSGRILSDQKFQGQPELCEAALDLCKTSFCVPVMERYSPIAISIALEVHWYHPDVSHRGIESMCRQVERVAHIIGGQSLMISIKAGCKRCRMLNLESVEVAMGPVQDVNLCIAPAFYASQVDIFGPFKCYSSANKRATLKVWFVIFCCCTTGAISIQVMEDYSTDAFVLGFVRFSCQFGYPRYLLPDAGSQLVKGCEDMEYSFVDTKQVLSVEYGVEYTPCPVGAHYIHGKVERKIREVKKNVRIAVQNERLSIIQWETLMAQIANSINNLPIGLKSKTNDIENLDLLTPNRLILGRNNDRCPNKPLIICPDHKKMVETNANIFKAWFKAWIVSYVPTLVERPKWHKNEGDIKEGDVVLFLKSEKEFDLQYQYGMVSKVHKGRDGLVRKVDVTYQNHNEGVKRVTHRGVRELVIIHPVDELDIYEQLYELFENCQ